MGETKHHCQVRPEDQALNNIREWVSRNWDVSIKSTDSGAGSNSRDTLGWFDDHAVYLPKEQLLKASQAQNLGIKEAAIGRLLHDRNLLHKEDADNRFTLKWVPQVGKLTVYALKRPEFDCGKRDEPAGVGTKNITSFGGRLGIYVPTIEEMVKSIKSRPRRGNAPIAIAANEVNVSGEELSPIWWRGSQWAVTKYGIEALDGCYVIERERLGMSLPRHSWPEHMSGKVWVNIDDFTTAWLVALSLHGHAVEADLVRDVCRRTRLRHNDGGI